MKVITMASHKGGSGKTTTGTNVAHGIAMMLEASGFRNPKVLVVDTDSQSHSTLLLTGRKDYSEDKSLIRVLEAQRQGGDVRKVIKDVIVKSQWSDNVHVLPASIGLDNTEESLVGQDGNVFFLQRILNHIKDDYTVVIIDTCPKFSLLTKMSILASDDVMIPFAPQFLDADGLVSMINKVYEIRDAWACNKPDVTGIVVVRYHKTINEHRDILEEIKKHEGLSKLLLGVVPLNAEITYSQTAMKSIFEFNARCPSAREYANVTRSIATRIFKKA